MQKELLATEPKEEDFEIAYVYEKGTFLWHGHPSKIPYNYKNKTIEIVLDEEKYKLAKNAYNDLVNNFYREAYENLEEFMGWENVDKKIIDWIKLDIYETTFSGGYLEKISRAYDYKGLIEALK